MGKGDGKAHHALEEYFHQFANSLPPYLPGFFPQPFEQITSLTDVAEGTIVRVITRLDETCREVRDAARVIGDAERMNKMEEAQTKIKRDSELFLFWYNFLMKGTVLTSLCLKSIQLYSQQACISKETIHRLHTYIGVDLDDGKSAETFLCLGPFHLSVRR